ncbi:MAG: hypothetical protein J6D08_14120 [Lachnospiraceae bacterium]|nr:hypothetical protein [Lachnospiraceae bacterium]
MERRKRGKKRERLLDALARERIDHALEMVLITDSHYQSTVKRQDAAVDQIDNIGLTSKQFTVVDRALSAANQCGAVYGAVAYKQGLKDGVKLAAELAEIT